VDEADFTVVMAVTDPARGARGGISAFVVDRGTPGFEVARAIPIIGGHTTYEVVLDNCRLPATSAGQPISQRDWPTGTQALPVATLSAPSHPEGLESPRRGSPTRSASRLRRRADAPARATDPSLRVCQPIGGSALR
jgi:hypothetical protein